MLSKISTVMKQFQVSKGVVMFLACKINPSNEMDYFKLVPVYTVH